MNNFRINHSFDNAETARHVRCAKGKGAQQFNQSVKRGQLGAQSDRQFLPATNGASKTSITKSNVERLSNSSSQNYGPLDVQITRFALHTISQIIGLISNLVNSLGFETNGPGNLIGTSGGSPLGGSGNFGYQPIFGGNNTISINFAPGHSGHYQNNGQTIVIRLPGGSGGYPTPPAPPEPPVVTPREAPKAGDTYIRLGPVDEASKTGELSGQARPNPREISNAVADQDGKQTSNQNNASDLLWSWGQFIDHDMILTKEGEEKAFIAVPRGDPDLDPAHTGNSHIPFTRSHAEADENGNREQVNEQTALIDGSMIYGATEEKTAELRSHEGGKLKIGDDSHLLAHPKEKVLSGDPRAAEQPGLLSLQTLFVREHNRQADLIAAKHPDWSDDRIFNEARRIVTNEIQAITYNEFLPILLGGEAPVSAYTLYDPSTVNGQVSSEFSTAAFRFGHTMVNDTIAYKDDQGTLKQATLDEVFFNPEFTHKEGIGSVLAGQSDQKAQAVDPMIVDSLRNRLFGPPQAGGPGMDLASLNIQRGRDHNIATYNDMREAMGYQRIESFDDPIFQDGVGAKLAEVYDFPDDIDLWVGGLAEKPLGNSMLGLTFTSIVDEQFARTAAADPNFYTKTASAEEITWLDRLSLADIVRANSTDAYIDNTPFMVD